MSLEVAVTDDPSDEALDLIGSGLDQFNLNAAGYADRRTLAVLVTDPASGEVVPGERHWACGLWICSICQRPTAATGWGRVCWRPQRMKRGGAVAVPACCTPSASRHRTSM